MKECFARSSLSAAVGAVLAAAAFSMPAHAVNHTDNGLGEVGLAPYYTVRSGYDTNISVVNTSDRYVVAFKIRFREGANSRDARDFNVFLSPNDVWTATVTMGPDGVTPIIQTRDTSCTAPWRRDTGGNAGSVFVPKEGAPGVYYLNMTSIDYTGGTSLPADGYVTDPVIARTQEGHFEIIEMGVADPAVSTLAAQTVHGSTQNCGAVAGVYAPVNNPITVTGSGLGCEADTTFAVGDTARGTEAFKAEFCEPLNVLKISADLIRVDLGLASSMPITTLANFVNPATGGAEDPAAPDATDIMFEPSSPEPSMASAIPFASVQIVDGAVVAETFFGSASPADAVSSLLSATDVLNEYALGGAANAQTAWVVTFPTKNFYVDGGLIDPFQRTFGSGGSCVTVNYEYYDREERAPTTPPGDVLPSPLPETPVEVSSICWETQTVNFTEEGNLLGALHNYRTPLEADFTSGWLRLGFPDATSIASDGGTLFNGLPVIGFSMKVLENGVVDNANRTYSIVTPHAYYRDVQ